VYRFHIGEKRSSRQTRKGLKRYLFCRRQKNTSGKPGFRREAPEMRPRNLFDGEPSVRLDLAVKIFSKTR
ncbi:MAG: hypothetical protein LBU21_04880, partial [Treponema sp.]|nr:hypothetical protein [Treponema sp.]